MEDVVGDVRRGSPAVVTEQQRRLRRIGERRSVRPTEVLADRLDRRWVHRQLAALLELSQLSGWKADRGHDPGRARGRPPLPLVQRRVRLAGLDITVHQSDQRRAPGHLARQGHRRCAGRCLKRRSALHADAALTVSITRNRPSDWGLAALLSVARKILKDSYHLLRELGKDALASA
jgi:hypothetical protein